MKVVFLNSKKINWDNRINFSVLGKNVDIFEESSEEEIIERSKGADALISKELFLDAKIIYSLDESVKLILEAGTGYNNIDLIACEERGITVCNIPAYSTKRVAHTAIMMMLNLSSSMMKQKEMLVNKDYSNFEYMQVDHYEVNGKTLGIIGTGNIGQEVAGIAHILGMNVIAYTKSQKEDTDIIHYVSLEELLKTSDFVSLHCALNSETYHLLDKERLSMMKKTSFVVNTSRGGLICERDLIEALQNGVIAGAGLDVLEEEPPRNDNPLLQMSNVVVTPHMGWKAIETRQRLVDALGQNIREYEMGTPINVVSK